MRLLDADHNHTLRRFDTPEARPDEVVGLRDDHPAVIEGRSIFPKSVAHPDDDERILVSGHNNPKLGKVVLKGPMKGFPIYHLTLEERRTCPRSCRMWSGCYGNTMPFARRNDAWTGTRLFVALDHELGVLQRQYPGGFLIRLHTLGDFFSEQYVAAWRGWLEDFPALHVFGYTSCSPMAAEPNERAIGQAVAQLANENWERFAIRLSGAEPGPARAVVVEGPDSRLVMCPAQSKDSECCATCGLCWAPALREKAIGFLRHGMIRQKGPRLSVEAREERAIAKASQPKRKRGRPPMLADGGTFDGRVLGDRGKARPDRNAAPDRVERLAAAAGITPDRAKLALERHSIARAGR